MDYRLLQLNWLEQLGNSITVDLTGSSTENKIACFRVLIVQAEQIHFEFRNSESFNTALSLRKCGFWHDCPPITVNNVGQVEADAEPPHRGRRGGKRSE
jgi:hypothetical protein